MWTITIGLDIFKALISIIQSVKFVRLCNWRFGGFQFDDTIDLTWKSDREKRQCKIPKISDTKRCIQNISDCFIFCCRNRHVSWQAARAWRKIKYPRKKNWWQVSDDVNLSIILGISIYYTHIWQRRRRRQLWTNSAFRCVHLDSVRFFSNTPQKPVFSSLCDVVMLLVIFSPVDGAYQDWMTLVDNTELIKSYERS